MTDTICLNFRYRYKKDQGTEDFGFELEENLVEEEMEIQNPIFEEVKYSDRDEAQSSNKVKNDLLLI